MNYDTIKIVSPGYELRPEIIESAYYLYYFTRDLKYRQMGMKYFDSLVKYCRRRWPVPHSVTLKPKPSATTWEASSSPKLSSTSICFWRIRTGSILTKTVLNTEAHPLNRMT